jgi:hypothetical protein
MKLIYEASPIPIKCQLCKRTEVIKRKIVQAKERVARWESEGINPVSTDKEYANIAQWQRELREIEVTKQTKMRSI